MEEQKYKVVFDELKLVPGNYITATSELGVIVQQQLQKQMIQLPLSLQASQISRF